MVERRAIPREISDEAARWVAERDTGLLSESDEAELARWLEVDPIHRQAFERASSLWSALDGVPETPGMRPQGLPAPRPSARRRRRTPPRRPGMLPGKGMQAAAAACLALAVVTVSLDLPTRIRADAITATGEQRTVTLPDGSVVFLNTGSAVAIDYRPAARRVRLLEGEAIFSVKADPARPFTVAAAGGTTRALGTRFIVREEGDGASVTVTEHRVLVSYRDQKRELGEGERLSFGKRQGIGGLEHVDIADAEAWARGRLVVVNRPLGEVVAELARYHRGYIHVSADVASLRVSGNFRTDDPVAALAQIGKAVGVGSTRLTNRLIFLHK